MAATRSNVVGGSDYTSGANREDLQGFITLTSAEKTPFLSTIGTNTATNARHEWATQDLRDPGTNQQSTSFSFDTANNVDQTVKRVSNYVQTYGETIHIDGLQMKSKSIGEAKDWFQNTVNIRKLELRRDIERQALHKGDTDASHDAYDSGNTPRMASVFAYAGVVNRLPTTSIEFSDDTALTTTAGEATYIWGNSNQNGSKGIQFTAAPTKVTLTQSHINDTLRVVSENGGDLNMVMVPTGLKAAVSELLIAGNGGAAQRRASEMAKRLNLAVDSVLTEFGYDLTIAHNYIMQKNGGGAEDGTVLFYNTNAVKRTVMQPYTMEMDGVARFGKAGILFCAETLEVRSPNDVAFIMGAQA